MTIDEIAAAVTALEGVLVLRPQPGDGTPRIAWGDAFFYYAPTGEVPPTQPFATIVTKDYPDDDGSRLDRPGVFRLNVHASAARFRELLGRDPRDPAPDHVDASAPDVILAHPVYGHLGWVAVVNPAEGTSATAMALLTEAYDAARNRYRRREGAQDR